MNNNGEAVLKAIQLSQPETVIESEGQRLKESFWLCLVLNWAYCLKLTAHVKCTKHCAHDIS